MHNDSGFIANILEFRIQEICTVRFKLDRTITKQLCLKSQLRLVLIHIVDFHNLIEISMRSYIIQYLCTTQNHNIIHINAFHVDMNKIANIYMYMHSHQN